MLVVVGNTTLDTAFRVERLPVPGETVLASGIVESLGGKGANQAVAAARCGAPVAFVSAVGADAAGQQACRILAHNGIGLGRIHRHHGDTDRSFITVSQDGENAIVSTHAAASSLTADIVDPALADLRAGDVLLMQGNLSAEVSKRCLRRGKAAGACTIVNPAPIQFGYDDLWPMIDIAVLNAVELADLSGSADAAAGGRTLRAQGAGTVIVTLGADGAAVVDDRVRHVPAPSVAAVDTTAAGDVFCGVLAALIDGGAEVFPAAQRAADAAGLSVTRAGAHTAIPTAAELARLGTRDRAAAAAGPES